LAKCDQNFPENVINQLQWLDGYAKVN